MVISISSDDSFHDRMTFHIHYSSELRQPRWIFNCFQTSVLFLPSLLLVINKKTKFSHSLRVFSFFCWFPFCFVCTFLFVQYPIVSYTYVHWPHKNNSMIFFLSPFSFALSSSSPLLPLYYRRLCCRFFSFSFTITACYGRTRLRLHQMLVAIFLHFLLLLFSHFIVIIVLLPFASKKEKTHIFSSLLDHSFKIIIF